MNKGNKNVAVNPGERINIRTDGEFTVYELQVDQKTGELEITRIIAPRNIHDRYATFNSQTGYFKVRCKANVSWHYQQPVASHDTLDYTPIEIPDELQRQPTLKEEMKRFVLQTFNAQVQAQQDPDTPDEADDFDIDDDDDFDPTSGYEIDEMTEEFYDDSQTQPDNPPQEATEDDTAVSTENATEPTDPPESDQPAA